MKETEKIPISVSPYPLLVSLIPPSTSERPNFGDPFWLENSLAHAKVFPPEDNQTRSEFRDESDINFLLERYGALPPGRGVHYGAANFDDDLTTAFETLERAREAHDQLPPAVKKLYPNWQMLALEIARGEENPALGEQLNERIKALDEAEKQKAKAEAAASVNKPDGGTGGGSPVP